MKENKGLLIGLVIGALISAVLMFFFMQKKNAENITSIQNQHAQAYAMLIDSVRQSGLSNLMGPLLEKVENELNQSEARSLSDGTIMQLAALSEGFKPYAILQRDQLSSNKLSPERGHLLLMLLGMQMDIVSWKKILSDVTFANADLKKAELKGANLSGIDLSSADLSDSNLEGANLEKAILRFAHLGGSLLQQSILTKADATRADFSWADLSKAKIDFAILDGANLTAADCGASSLVSTNLHWANLSSSVFTKADLSDADLLGSLMEKTHFVETNLSRANFIKTVINQLDMTGANLEEVQVQDECWLRRLHEFSVAGADEILNKYFVRQDTTDQKITFLVVHQEVTN